MKIDTSIFLQTIRTGGVCHKVNDYEILTDANNLYDSYKKCCKGCDWKKSVQTYEANYLKNIYHSQQELSNQNYQPRPFNEFELNDRGRQRDIKAVDIHDRVVIKNLCDNVLVPELGKYMIYDNGASVKGKGFDFAINRFEEHLKKYYRHYGNEGYVLKIDFSKFFDNIDHVKLFTILEQYIDDERILDILHILIDSFRIDVSNLSDEEISMYDNTAFDILKYQKECTLNELNNSGDKFLDRSIGIGSQVSQIIGLLYPTKIDNYCKIVRGMKYYGRYMDDIYVIHSSKEFLTQLLSDISNIASELGIFINIKKTQIIKLANGVTFLKVRFILTDSGKIIKLPCKDKVKILKRKLRKFASMYYNYEMEYIDIYRYYKSWRNNVSNHYNSYTLLQETDKYFYELFKERRK